MQEQKSALILSQQSPDDWLAAVSARANDVADMGQWPAWIDRTTSLAARLPDAQKTASGFDAGIACALSLIPTPAQKLAATLHAAYTPEAVAEVRSAIAQEPNGNWHVKDANSPTCWWLAACSLCLDGDTVDVKTFRQQLRDFEGLQTNPDARKTAAEKTLNAMCTSFNTKRGYAFGGKDGSMQGAYIAGHDVAVMYAPHHGVFFIGTFRPSLGLENFDWGKDTDDKGRAKSGPVHGSRQFVKCANESELMRALDIALRTLKPSATPAAKSAAAPIKPK